MKGMEKRVCHHEEICMPEGKGIEANFGDDSDNNACNNFGLSRKLDAIFITPFSDSANSD